MHTKISRYTLKASIIGLVLCLTTSIALASPLSDFGKFIDSFTKKEVKEEKKDVGLNWSDMQIIEETSHEEDSINWSYTQLLSE